MKRKQIVIVVCTVLGLLWSGLREAHALRISGTIGDLGGVEGLRINSAEAKNLSFLRLSLRDSSSRGSSK